MNMYVVTVRNEKTKEVIGEYNCTGFTKTCAMLAGFELAGRDLAMASDLTYEQVRSRYLMTATASIFRSKGGKA